MKLRRLLFLSAMTLAAAIPLMAKTTNVMDVKHSITDNAIVYPETYEQDTQKLLEGWYMKNYTATDNRYKTASDPNTSDAVIMERLASLPTAIDLPFNQIVRSYIDRYTKRGRAGVAAMLGLSHYYMPIFEQALEEEGLPLELKYLPVIESGLNPNAVSKMGATGLWQFMLSAAKGYNLEVNSLVDERRDPYQSSRAAAAFLKDLYATYGDWSLVIAAYNCGPGNVNKALRRAGGDSSKKDFWTIYPYLPAETRGYVPMFIAATYVMNYYPEHNISPVLATKPLVTDTVAVDSRVHFNQISKVLDIPMDELRILNPQFRNDLIPGSQKKPYMLILPTQQIHAYLMSENDIKRYDADRYARRVVAEPGVGASALDDDTRFADSNLAATREDVVPNEADDELAEEIAQVQKEAKREAARTQTSQNGNKRVYSHKVQEGETLADIATMYGVTKSEIKMQNNLRREAVRVGQDLKISTTKQVAEQKVAQKSTPARTQTARNNSESVSSRNNSTAQTTAKARTRETNSNTAANSNNSSRTSSKKSTTKNEQTAQASSKTSSKSNSKKNEQTAQSSSKKNSRKNEQTAQASSKKNSKKTEQTAQSSKAKKNEHAIKDGENLTVIAKKYGVSVDEIKKANGMKNDNIRAGKSLTIPTKKKETKSSSKSSTSKNSSSKSKKKK
ncbi:MAG: transglycosylase SLT domain-containing protein [Bacteroidales bacterium]|nr:transglycosylase SLT domain-containing protein [Bacteroidales bacterium]